MPHRLASAHARSHSSSTPTTTTPDWDEKTIEKWFRNLFTSWMFDVYLYCELSFSYVIFWILNEKILKRMVQWFFQAETTSQMWRRLSPSVWTAMPPHSWPSLFARLLSNLLNIFSAMTCDWYTPIAKFKWKRWAEVQSCVWHVSFGKISKKIRTQIMQKDRREPNAKTSLLKMAQLASKSLKRSVDFYRIYIMLL